MIQNLKGKTAISGLGITEQGKVYGHSTAWFAAEAIRLALETVGLRKGDIEGVLSDTGVNAVPGVGGRETGIVTACNDIAPPLTMAEQADSMNPRPTPQAIARSWA